jgi:Acyltransferase family
MRCADGVVSLRTRTFAEGISDPDRQCLSEITCRTRRSLIACYVRAIHKPITETEVPLRLGVDPRFQDRERQPGLDLLRALAIVVVVIYHAALFGFKLPGRVDRFGWIGVDLFFVLSGYLIGAAAQPPL